MVWLRVMGLEESVCVWGGEDFCISMGPNLPGLLCTVRGPLWAYTRGLYLGVGGGGGLALFNTITTPPFCPDLLVLFVCISRSQGLQSFQLQVLLNG